MQSLGRPCIYYLYYYVLRTNEDNLHPGGYIRNSSSLGKANRPLSRFTMLAVLSMFMLR